jgi:DNA-binding winged helix-turn-helix (wHTH) protein/TolB-like protein/Tfp pilus assembly protein PilF
MLTLEELNGGFSLGDWDVLPSQRILRRDEHVERPEPMVFDVLLALAERDGDLVTKDELIDEVWKGRAFSDEVIQQKISQLRGHLGDQRPYEYVGTLPRKGYQLLQPVVLHRQSETESHGPPPVEARSDRRWKAVATAVLLGFLAIAWVIGNDREEGLPAACSLAVLPIENLSGDPNNLYIAEGIKNTLAQRLNELPECTIKIAREVYDGEWTDIAKQLGVASLLHGTVQLQDDTVKIDYFIILGRDGTQSDSGQVSGALGNLFDIQERLARAVRSKLAGDSVPELITKPAPDSAAHNSFMRGMYKLEHRFEGNNLEDAIELFQESIRRDESYGPAYLGLATAYALLPDYRNADLETNHRLAIETIEEGIEKDGSITDPAGAIYGFVYYQKKQWLEAEKNYQRAVTAPVVDANAFSWYSMMLAATGRIEDARDMALAAEDLAPDNGVLASRIAMVYTWLNNTAKAYEYFDRANDLHATGTIHVIAHALLLQRNGQLELSQNLAFAAVTMESGATDWIDKVYAALGERTPERIAIALDAINQAWEERRVSPEPVLVTRSLLGDIDGAMAIARLLEEPGMLFSMEILFMPELMPLREHPEFLPLLERLGVVGYWDSVGCRWVDHRVDCQD